MPTTAPSTRRRTKKATRSVIRAAEEVSIPLRGTQLRAYRAWERRRDRVGMTIAEALRFAAGWLPTVLEQWTMAAEVAGWTPSSEQAPNQECDKEPSALGHVREAGGWVAHLVVENAGSTTETRAKRCHRVTADVYWVRTWRDDDRLTYDELRAGVTCRGCGRGFFGGPEWVAILHRTPEQATVIEAEEAEFRRLHPECHSGQWTVPGGGIQHCMRCCAPPPMSPETEHRIAQILVDAMGVIADRDKELEQRWKRGAAAAGR